MRIGIIGFGRFGQIFSKYLKSEAEVFVTSRSDKSAEAKSLGVAWVAGDDIFKVDYLMLCVPISETKNTLEKIKDKILPGTVVLDTCSVKAYPCQWLAEIVKKDIEIVGTHPMFGPDSAKESLVGRQIVLCPLRIGQEKLDELTKLFKSLNLKVIQTTPEEHDRETANSLALVHFIGRGLGEAGIKEEEITTLGFDRLLSVKKNVENDSWQLFEDLQKYNPFAQEARLKLINSLEKINKELNKGGFDGNSI